MSPTLARRRSSRLVGPTIAAAVATSLLALHAPAARGADDKSECVASYDRSQVLRRDHRLGRAREELRSCSRAICPALVRNDCLAWLDQVQTEFPSLAIRATKDGADVADVKVTQDNEVVATRLEGSSLEVEPGEHSFRFETGGAPPLVLNLVVREREKDRVVPVTFVSQHQGESEVTASGTSGVSRPISPGIFVLGGVAVAGLVTFGVLGLVGKSDESSLQSNCSPNCSQDAIGKVRTEYIAGDIAFGVGAAALVSAGVWYLLRPKQAEHATLPRNGTAIAPTRGGAVLGWNGTF